MTRYRGDTSVHVRTDTLRFVAIASSRGREQGKRRVFFFLFRQHYEKIAGEGAFLVDRGERAPNRGERTSCDGLCGKFGARKGYRTPARGQLSHSREEPEARGSEVRVQRQGRRRPNATHKSKVTGAELEISRLQRNGLPTYQAPYVPRAVAELVGSAAACIRSTAAATRALPAGRRRGRPSK